MPQGSGSKPSFFFFRGGGNIRSGGPIAALTKRMTDERWELDLESAGKQRRRGNRGGGVGGVIRLRGCVRRVHRKHLLHGSERGTWAAARLSGGNPVTER